MAWGWCLCGESSARVPFCLVLPLRLCHLPLGWQAFGMLTTVPSRRFWVAKPPMVTLPKVASRCEGRGHMPRDVPAQWLLSRPRDRVLAHGVLCEKCGPRSSEACCLCTLLRCVLAAGVVAPACTSLSVVCPHHAAQLSRSACAPCYVFSPMPLEPCIPYPASLLPHHHPWRWCWRLEGEVARPTSAPPTTSLPPSHMGARPEP